MVAYRRMSWLAVGAVVFAIGVTSTAWAQGRGGGAPYTPAEGARDLRATMFNWMWHQGMLKGADERDMVATLEYQGSGTIQVDGQPCTLSRFRESTNYQIFGQRIQYTCTLPNGQTVSDSEVVSWHYAWNEDAVGAEIGGTPGTVVPKPATVQERLIRIWANPQGAAKSALAGMMDTWTLGANPGTVIPDGVMSLGRTTLSWDTGKAVFTFPIPGVAGAMGTATLNADYMVEKVVVTQGATTTEFTYSDYQDWNNPLHKIEVFYAGRLTERRNGAVVRDLTTRETETGNVYVVVPVPPTVERAMNVTTSAPAIVWARQEPPTNTSAPTPRINGRPDMTGVWAEFNIGWIGNYGSRRCGPNQVDCYRQTNQTEDFALYSPSRFGMLTRPLYKTQYWDRVQQLDMWTNKEDPVMTCQPLGLPRQGPPRRIFQTETDITFLWGPYADAGGGLSEFRVVPIDGREHGPNAEYGFTYFGETVGHWEGDTLVLDSVGFVDTTWIGRGGFFHSDKMRIVERFRREGDAIFYDLTLEDPEVLVEPLVFPTRILRRNENPNAGLIGERGNCETDFETEAVGNQIRH